jgi:uncharacterized protein (DUF433 family)
MSKVVSLRLKDQQMERLERAARRLGRTPSETAALLLEESLREREFAFIEFRDSFVGRQAYIKGTRITVWQLVDIARSFGDVGETAANLEIPAVAVSAALAYAAAYPEEIESAIADNSPSIDELKRLIPNLHIRTVDASAL